MILLFLVNQNLIATLCKSVDTCAKTSRTRPYLGVCPRRRISAWDSCKVRPLRVCVR